MTTRTNHLFQWNHNNELQVEFYVNVKTPVATLGNTSIRCQQQRQNSCKAATREQNKPLIHARCPPPAFTEAKHYSSVTDCSVHVGYPLAGSRTASLSK